MRKNKLPHYQNIVLKALASKIEDFYLAGGTALGLFYFQHRLSLDLDFFTKDFTYSRIKEIVEYLRRALKVKIKAAGQNLAKGKVKMAVYNIYFGGKGVLKIDFIEDIIKFIKRPKVVEGINILSLEDIYLRKIYALLGLIETFDEIGRRKSVGGRVDAKDFYDLYFLSHTFMPLSDFAERYCDATIKEGLIRWFRTYDRMEIIDGILTLDVDKKIDYKNIEGHFKEEINRIIERQIGEI